MIYLNDEVQRLDDVGSDVGREYAEAKKFFDEIGWPLRFVVKDSFVTREEDDKGTTHFTMPQHTIPHSATEYDAYGSKKWVYSRIPPKKDKNQNWKWNEPFERLTKKSFTLDEKEADKAFFLWFKSKPFKNLYNLEDRKKAAANAVQNRMEALKLEQAFYGESSLLQKDEVRLRTVARAYSVRDVDSLDKAQVLQALEGQIKTMIKRGVKTLDEFLESITLDVDTELASDIQKAVDEKCLIADDKTCSWYFVTPEGQVGDKIVSVPRNNWFRANDVLKDYLQTNADALERFKAYSEVGGHGDLTIDLDNLEKLDWSEVVVFANLHGIKGTGAGRTKAKVMKEIREKFVK